MSARAPGVKDEPGRADAPRRGPRQRPQELPTPRAADHGLRPPLFVGRGQRGEPPRGAARAR
eukprot:925671-Prorocentrum_minimum.AAC.1